MTSTLYPFSVRRIAETLPPNPDPMMTKSYVLSFFSGDMLARSCLG